MAKQLNVSMNFTANTTQAKSQIQELSNLLTKVAYGTNVNINADQMKQASSAAKELALHLNNAYNSTTGNFDLSKLSASLNKAGTDVNQLSSKLLMAGETGQQAFIKLAQSIAAADQPMITLGSRLNNFLTTLKNTARWQISSSLLHGLMGGVQSAYYYAQDLNESLNNIRIVTGKDTEQMAKFAESANKAAKALSTTTTEYTDASLIYYQQGLSDKEVEARTDITVKMANVTGNTAEKISDQLTAVWNNFYDGTKTLESYVDIMTALGAATASSSDEISEGLEKFAAVSETVGLSYEYAATALATVTAETRQSADVVGTAFRTIFSRLEGLKQDPTSLTDDGVSLNKYSQALANVGVNILTATGELRDMDSILDSLGERWSSLSDKEKVALATTVGGARQYSTFIALMDNWQTSFQRNLEVANDSEGTLARQAEIYAESWEAAKDRVRAAAEGIYQSLIDDEFFINLNNIFAETINGIDNFIDKAGGLKTVLIGLGSIIFSMISNKIGPAVDNLKQNFLVLTKGANAAYNEINARTQEQIKVELNSGNYSLYDEQQLRNATGLISANQKLNKVKQDLTESERAAAEIELQGLELQQQAVLKLVKAQEDLENKQAELRKTSSETIASMKEELQNVLNQKDIMPYVEDVGNEAWSRIEALGINANNIFGQVEESGRNAAERVFEAWSNQSTESLKLSELFGPTIASLDELQKKANDFTLEQIKAQFEGLTVNLPQVVKDSRAFKLILENIKTGDVDKIQTSIINLVTYLQNGKLQAKDFAGALQNLGFSAEDIKKVSKAFKEEKQVTEDLAEATKEATKAREDLNNRTNAYDPTHTVKGVEAMSKLASSAMSVVFAVNSINSAVQTLKNPDATGWEKWSSSIMAVAFTLPALTRAGQALSTVWKYMAEANVAAITAISAGTTTTISNTVATEANTAVTEEANKQAIIRAQTAHNEAVAKRDAAAAALEKAVAEWQEEEVTENWDVIYLQNTAAQSVSTNETVKHTAATLKEAEAEVVATGAALESAKSQIVDAGAKDVNTVSTGILSKAVKGLTASIKTLYTFITNNPVILLAAAAIAVLVVAIKGWYNETHKARIAAKEAKEQLDKVTESVNEVKQSIEDVNSRLDTLGDKYDKIKSLTRGTAEWRQAVYEVNTEVRELLELYNLLDKPGMWHWENGAMVLSDEYYKEVEQQQTDQYIAAQQVQSAATQLSDKADIDAQIEVIKQDYLNQLDAALQTEISSIESGIEAGLWTAYENYAANTIEPLDYNTWYQTEGQVLANQFGADQLSNLIADDVLNTLTNAYQKNPDSFNYSEDYLRKLNLNDNAIDLLQNDKLQSYFNDLFDSINKFGAKYQTGYQNNILLQNSTAEAMQHTETSTVEAEILSQIFADKMGAELTEAIKLASKELTSEDRKAYAKAAGLIYDDKTDRVYAKDSEGKMDEKSPISDENIANWKAQNELAKEYGDQLANIIDATHRLLNLSKADFNIDVIEKFLQNRTGENKEVYLDEIRENIAEYAELLGVTQEKLQAKLDENNSQWLINNAKLIGQLFSDDLAVQQAAYAQLYDSFYQDNFAQLGLDIINLQGELQGILDANPLSTEIQLNSDIIDQVNNLLGQIDDLTQEEAERILDMFNINGELKVRYHWVVDYSTGQATQVPYFQLDVANAYVHRPGGTSTGGSTGGDNKFKKDPKELRDELDRYHVLNQQVKQLNDNISDLDKIKDRAFGLGKLRAMDQEISKYKQLLEVEQQYQAAIAEDLVGDWAAIESYGAVRDPNTGIITNYEQIFTDQLAIYNQGIADAKAGIITDEQFEEIEKSYETFKKNLTQYEETLELAEEHARNINELQNNIFDTKLSKIDYLVNINVEVQDNELEYLQYLLEKTNDDAFEAAKNIENLQKQVSRNIVKSATYDAGIMSATLLQLGNSISKVLKGDFSSILTFATNLVDTISGYRDELLQVNSEMLELHKTMSDKVLESFDAWIDKFDKLQDKLSVFNSMIGYYETILDLTDKLSFDTARLQLANAGVEFNLPTQEKLNQYRMDNVVGIFKTAKGEVESILKAQKEMMAALDNADDQQSLDLWEQNLEHVNERLLESEENVLSSWADAIQTAVDIFNKALDDINESIQKEIESQRNLFDRTKALNELYVDEYEKIYELTKITRDINNDLSETKSIKNKEKLLQLEQEINKLQNSNTQLSKYDIEYLQKKYDLRLAEIALEDARNASNSMRLVRNEITGNWDYVFTSDQDTIDKASQNYEDKLYAMQQLNDEYITNLQDNILSLRSEWAAALAEIVPTEYESEDAYGEVLAQINESYIKQLNAFKEQLSTVLSNNSTLFNEDWTEYNKLTGYIIPKDSSKYTDDWTETLLSQTSGIDTLEDYVNYIINQQLDAANQMTSAYKDLNNQVNELMAATITLDENKVIAIADLYNHIAEDNKNLVDGENDTDSQLDGIIDEMNGKMTSLIGQLSEWETKNGDAVANLIKQNESLVEKYDKMIEILGFSSTVVEGLNTITDLLGGLSSEGSLIGIKKYGTGGYTGEWNNDDGRLAVLHQKELVLNQHDTDNLLSSVEVVRAIARTIDLSAAAASSSAPYMSLGANTAGLNAVQQDVTIHADFPSVTDRNEIEAAFDSLVNQASQWANRRR